VQEIRVREVSDYVNTVTPTLAFRLRASASSISVLRADVRAWLSEVGASTDEILDLQLACSEVLTMMIEQASTPVALIVDVHGTFERGTVTITIREYGLCRDAGVDEARPDHQTLGLTLIHALVDVFDVQAQTDGRTIVLERRVQSCAA
jgi:anti-sigma regulatory factor (Ser/Thr protein kinase)